MKPSSHVLLIVTAWALVCASCAPPSGFDRSRMVWADRAVEAAIKRSELPGAVLVVGRDDRIVYRKAYGHRSLQPTKTPMTEDTVFDLASLSKVVGCATSIMLLAERGQVCLNDRVATYLPAFGTGGKDTITIEQLLLHRSGLTPDNPLADYEDGPTAAVGRIMALPLQYPPGTDFKYSDVGYIVLGELVRAVDGRPLDRFAHDEVFVPLGMRDTTYNPPEAMRSRCAPTEYRNDHWMVGEVHDPRAYALNGVAGHAGLFSTANDLARWCRMILNFGTLDGRRVLAETTVREMVRARSLPDGTGTRGYGFDIDTGYSQARGNFFEPGTTFGHTGFTGTCLWIDPRHRAYFILLTNSVHPDGKGKVLALRRRVANVVASAMIEAPSDRYWPEPAQDPVSHPTRGSATAPH